MDRSAVACGIIALTVIAVLTGCRPEPAARQPAFDGYRGVTRVTDSASTEVTAYPGLTLATPAARGLQADAFVHLEGSVSGADPAGQYALVRVYLEADPALETYQWVRGTFEEDVWLRFGPGDYVIKVLKAEVTADRDGEGAISSWTYWIPEAYRINVTNSRNEDGRHLYPSGAIQADEPAVLEFALQHAGDLADDLDAVRALHDAVVKLLAYDFDSTVPGASRKQDALSVFRGEIAVCEGYSTLYAALLRSIGIAAAYVSGSAGGSHAWSRVRVEQTWNYVDTTWDDPIVGGHSDYPNGENLRYDYFWKPGFADHTVAEESVTRGVGGGTDPRAIAPGPEAARSVSGRGSIPGFPSGWY